MKDKTWQQLIDELAELRRRIAELTATEAAGEQAKEVSRASREELLALFDNAPITMILLDRERRVLRVNRIAVEILDRSAEEMMGLRAGAALRCFHSLDDPRGCGFGAFCESCTVRRTVLDTFETGNAYRRVEARLPLVGGEQKQLLISTNLLHVLGGQMVPVYIEDITDRKRAEEELKLNETRLNSLLELSQRAHELSELDIVQMAIEEAVKLTGSKIGYLHFVNPDERTIQLVTWSEKTLEQCTAAYDSHYPLDQAGVWADCVRQRKPVVHNDYQNLTNKKGYPTGHSHITRHMSVPIFDEGKTALILGVGNKNADYDESDVRQLLLIGDHTVRILRRKRAEGVLREQTLALDERVKELNCLYGISALVEQPGISLAEILQGTVELIPPAWQYPEITGARIVLEGLEFGTENFRGTSWRQASNIVVQDKRIGTLEVCYLEEKPASDEGPFMKEEKALLTAIAVRLSRIIARMRAEEALHRRMEELAVLHAIAVAGAEATSLDELIERVTEVIGETLYPDNFGVLLVDEAAGVLRVHPSYRGMRENPEDIIVPLDQGVTGQVASTGQPWRVPDVTREPVYLELNPDMRSELCVPLRIGERVSGAINAESQHLDAFSEDDERLMMTFAGQLATAIERVRLFEAERRRAEEAETLRQAGAAVTATLQQEEAIERILRELARVVPYDSAVVQLLREGYVENVGGRGCLDPTIVVGLRFPVPGDNPNTIVIQQRRPHILADAPAAYAGFREEPHTHIRSWLGVPLIVRDEVIGMLALDSEQPGFFTSDHAQLAVAFADQVAIAIENARLFREVQHLAVTDPLTGLHNRRHFFELAQREFDRARRYQYPLVVLMLDVDRFKQVNDTYGHAIGDQVLRAVAERCQKELRSTDVLGRYGGEEFAILLPETDLTGAQTVAEKLRQRLAEPVAVNGRPRAMITASIGVGPLDEQCVNLDVLLRRADEALYAAKKAGRDCVRAWQS